MKFTSISVEYDPELPSPESPYLSPNKAFARICEAHSSILNDESKCEFGCDADEIEANADVNTESSLMWVTVEIVSSTSGDKSFGRIANWVYPDRVEWAPWMEPQDKEEK